MNEFVATSGEKCDKSSKFAQNLSSQGSERANDRGTVHPFVLLRHDPGEGESVKELTEAFHEAVDDYLANCEDEGIEPDKSYSGVLNVRLTPAIHRQIAILARQAGLTLNAYIKDALEEKVEAEAAM